MSRGEPFGLYLFRYFSVFVGQHKYLAGILLQVTNNFLQQRMASHGPTDDIFRNVSTSCISVLSKSENICDRSVEGRQCAEQHSYNFIVSLHLA